MKPADVKGAAGAIYIGEHFDSRGESKAWWFFDHSIEYEAGQDTVTTIPMHPVTVVDAADNSVSVDLVNPCYLSVEYGP